MLDNSYFLSLNKELDALKNRVRNFINNNHWLTDGEWKESVLRSFLRRHLPKNVEIGRGFIITNEKPSSQIDVLIYDSTKPLLFQDGDLVFVTPDAVLGIIEVKTSLTQTTFNTSLRKLCSNIELVRRRSIRRRVYGIFAFEDYTTKHIPQLLLALKNNVDVRLNRIVNCICLGQSVFIRYEDSDPVHYHKPYHKYIAYNLPEMAAGYFIHNIIQGICPESVNENLSLWYPIGGKAQNRMDEIDLSPFNVRGGGTTKLPPKDLNELPIDPGTEDPNAS
jgi:hypothetical protein